MIKMRKPKRNTHQRFCVIFLISSFSFFFLSFDSVESKDFSSSESSTTDEISDWEARAELAKVLSYLKRYEESLQEYRILLRANPDSHNIKIEIAKVLFYQDKMDEALLELSTVPSQYIDDATEIMIADIYRKQKNYAKAEKIYSRYINKVPEDDKVRLKLAELLSWDKRYEEAIKQYQIILNHRPEDIQIRRRYAQILTWMGKDEEAIKEWKLTLE